MASCPKISVKLIFSLVILASFATGAGLMVQKTIKPAYAEEIQPELIVFASIQEQPRSQAETIMRTLAAAYPNRIGPVEFRNGDWAFPIRDSWFYYAEGRILPEERRNHAAEYRPMGLNYNYPIALPSWESSAEQRATRTRNWEEARNRQPQAQPARPSTRRSNYFLEALWNITNHDEAWHQQANVRFLGRTITIHSGLSQIMSRIDETIMNEARTNPEVRQWIDSLGMVTGWNWRSVASSGNRSSHSYGIAIDLLPANLRGQATYWLWSSWHDPQWWNIPYSGRYHPPDEVIRTFESFGFIWGGKWGNFDTMHFEYRPEIFIFSNLPLVD